MTAPTTECCDCAIIGGGPGGVTAAIYLARFHRQVLVFDSGIPRVRWSPWNRNYPGFPEGISGTELLARFKQQAEQFHVEIRDEWVTAIQKIDAGFCLEVDGRFVEARTVIMATGTDDQWPAVPDVKALAGQRIRVCPICDAYEATGKRVGLIGCGDRVAREALYLHHFTPYMTLFTHGRHKESPICDELTDRLCEEGIEVRGECVERLDPIEAEGVRVCMEDGSAIDVDMLFTALGCSPNSALGVALGAKADDQGYLLTDHWQATTVPGLYAVGDVTSQINQVTVAVGQAAVAATAVHNSLLDF